MHKLAVSSTTSPMHKKIGNSNFIRLSDCSGTSPPHRTTSHHSHKKHKTYVLRLRIASKEIEIEFTDQNEPVALAREICFRHGLQVDAVSILAAEISKAKNVLLPTHQTSQRQQHDKLYCHRLKASQVSRSSSSYSPQRSLYNILNQSSASPTSKHFIHDRVYQEGLKVIERRTRMCDHQHEKQVLEELSQVRTPQVNRQSIKMIGQYGGSQPVIEKMQIKKAERIESIKRKKQQQEMAECTFKPRINSCRTTASKWSEFPHPLHQNQLSTCKFKQPQFPFSPHINPVSEEMVGSSNFEQRQKRFISSKMMNIACLTQQKIWNETVDADTGHKLFHPKVGRAPKNKETSIQSPIRKFKNNIRSQSQPSLSTIPCKSSDRYYNEYLNKKLTILFDHLDSQNQNIIFPHLIDLSSPNNKHLAPVIKPLFDKLINPVKQIYSLTRQQFIDQMKQLYEKRLTMYERQIVQSVQREEVQIRERPRIDSKRDVFVSLYNDAEDRKKQLTTERERREKELAVREMAECTFKPRAQTAK